MKSAASDGLKAQHTALKQREANTSLIWEPAPVACKPAPIVTIAIESEIIALIERPIDPAETHRAGNDRKERELYGLLDRLSDLEAHALRRRLSAARASDPLVASLGRISIDRRVRIVAFIDDTRRRMRCAASRVPWQDHSTCTGLSPAANPCRMWELATAARASTASRRRHGGRARCRARCDGCRRSSGRGCRGCRRCVDRRTARCEQSIATGPHLPGHRPGGTRVANATDDRWWIEERHPQGMRSVPQENVTIATTSRLTSTFITEHYRRVRFEPR